MGDQAEEINNDPTGSKPASTPQGQLDSIGDILEEFIKNLNSLNETFPVSMMTIDLVNFTSRTIFGLQKEALEKEFGGKLEDSSEEQIRNLYKGLRKFSKSEVAGTLVAKSFVVSLVSQYDAFLGSLIRFIFLSKPETLNVAEKQLTFSELMTFDSIEAAREHVIEKEVESVLRKSHSDQIDWLAARFDVVIKRDLPYWPVFIELTERRNLFVHTNGVISQQYLSNCEKHKCSISEDAKRGTKLSTDYQYFKQSYECIFEVSIKLAHVLWRKLLTSQRLEADRSLIAIGYELLIEKKYKMAQMVFGFAVDVVKQYSSLEYKLMFVLNYAQSYKWDNDDKTCRKILGGQDWSAAKDSLKLGQQVLSGDFVKAKKTMLQIGNKSDDIKKDNYKEWPIFNDFRASEEFKSAYGQLFGNPDDSQLTAEHPDAQEINKKIEIISALDEMIYAFVEIYTGVAEVSGLQDRFKAIFERIRTANLLVPKQPDIEHAEPHQTTTGEGVEVANGADNA